MSVNDQDKMDIDKVSSVLKRLTLTPRQQSLGTSRLYHKLVAEKLRFVVLVADPGTGKTLMTIELWRNSPEHRKRDLVVIAQGKYLPIWDQTLQRQVDGYDGRIIFPRKEWRNNDGMLFVIDMDTNKKHLEAMRDYIASRKKFRTKPIVFFIDLNCIHVSGWVGGFKIVHPITNHLIMRHSMVFDRLLWLVEACVSKPLVIVDEAESLRSNEGLYRSLDDKVINGIFQRSDVVAVTGTPFAGQKTDALNVAQMIGIDTKVDDAVWQRKLKERLIVITKKDIADESYPPSAVVAINVTDMENHLPKYVVTIVHAFLHSRLPKYYGSDCNTGLSKEEKETLSQNRITYYDTTRFMGVVFYALECVKTHAPDYPKDKPIMHLLVSLERVVCGYILRDILRVIFSRSTWEQLQDLGLDILKCFEQRSDGFWYCRGVDWVPPEGLTIHFNTTVADDDIDNDFVSQGCPSPKQCKRNRDDFKDGTNIIHFEGLFYGSRNWSAVIQKNRRFVIHVIPCGIPWRFDEFKQVISRTNRIDAKPDMPSNVLVFVSQYEHDVERNIWKPLAKLYKIEDDINGNVQLSQDMWDNLGRALRMNQETRLVQSLKAFRERSIQWTFEYFQPVSREHLLQLMCPVKANPLDPWYFLVASGIFPFKDLSINVVDPFSETIAVDDDVVMLDSVSPLWDSLPFPSVTALYAGIRTMLESVTLENLFDKCSKLESCTVAKKFLMETLEPHCRRESGGKDPRYLLHTGLEFGCQHVFDKMGETNNGSLWYQEYHLDFALNHLVRHPVFTGSCAAMDHGRGHFVGLVNTIRALKSAYNTASVVDDSTLTTIQVVETGMIEPIAKRLCIEKTPQAKFEAIMKSLFRYIDTEWKLITLPFNSGENHWVTLEIHREGHKLRVRNSMKGGIDKESGDTLARLVVYLNEHVADIPKLPDIPLVPWTIEEGCPTEQQKNSHDCGPHTIMRCLGVVDPECYTEEKCKILRRYVAWMHVCFAKHNTE